MEFKEILRKLKKERKFIFAISILGGLLGLAIFQFVPVKYRAVGSIFVSRSPEFGLTQDFTYEGYYAQQTAKNYAKTFIGILESVDVRKTALEKMEIPVTESTLRKAKRNLYVKEAAPQLITVQTKALDSVSAKSYWTNLTSTAVVSAEDLNKNGDSMIKLLISTGAPIVYKDFHNVWFNLYAGLAVGLFFSVFIVLFKEYSKK